MSFSASTTSTFIIFFTRTTLEIRPLTWTSSAILAFFIVLNIICITNYFLYHVYVLIVIVIILYFLHLLYTVFIYLY